MRDVLTFRRRLGERLLGGRRFGEARRVALAAALLATLAACGAPVDPDRPPLRDYEPPPLDDVPGVGSPSRI